MEPDSSALLVLYKLGQNTASSPSTVLVKPTGTFISNRGQAKKPKTAVETHEAGAGKK